MPQNVIISYILSLMVLNVWSSNIVWHSEDLDKRYKRSHVSYFSNQFMCHGTSIMLKDGYGIYKLNCSDFMFVYPLGRYLMHIIAFTFFTMIRHTKNLHYL